MPARDQEADAHREAKERRRRLEVAFAVVFGEEGKRNEHQALVWDWLGAQCFHTRPGMQRVPESGAVDAVATAIAASNHDLFLGIKALADAGTLPMNPGTHPQPQAIRE